MVNTPMNDLVKTDVMYPIGVELKTDFFSILHYIRHHYIQFLLMLLVIIIIVVVEYITIVNVQVFAMPSPVMGATASQPTKTKKSLKKTKK
jgi:hypothetical protein